MPKQTFHNLDDEKRTRFLMEAFREFCMHDYQQASISRIVKTLGIAKGSVYQYFDNKADLYLYLYEITTAKKAEYIQARPMAEGEDFFSWIESLWIEGLRFDSENPLYTGFLFNVWQERDAVARDLVENNQATAQAFFGPLFQQYQQAGYLRHDIDLDFLVHFFTQNAQNMAVFMMNRNEQDIRELVKEGKPFISTNKDEIMHYVAQLTKLLRSGMINS